MEVVTKGKNEECEPSPHTGSKRTTFRGAKRRCKSEWDALPLAKVAALAVGRGKYEQKRKTVSYKTALNICLSFLNDRKSSYDHTVIKGNCHRVKNPAKVIGIKYSDLCMHACSYHFASSVLPPCSGEADVKEKIKFYHHSYSVCRSRVRAGEICLANDISYLPFMEEQSICIK